MCLAVSRRDARTLVAQGYPAEMLDVVRRRCPPPTRSGSASGATARPAALGEQLTVAFFGSAYPHKGPQLLVEAAQRTGHELRVIIYGEVPAGASPSRLKAMDRRGVVELRGAFSPTSFPACWPASTRP